ncbi:hypothetical protein PsaNZ64_27695 [Pseudomonas syringae pv. actinidiae]|uniref:Uncharacterized protein n=1 Tax=Pseudomonas syringae pv. actinidiae TaxID=103796 RepID=A0A2P0QI83_PSESF|nr:hypothetical protein [Pseudomonas syringae]ARO45299.1 hypothetical protein [Pseudomonas syringae pv. actinidiae]OKS65404.1 hypothetical protein PsaNZ64_27695 [Pseudomonas syringae pv. actinidiae]
MELIYVELALFVLVGGLLQKYAKHKAQADYEAHCAEIAKKPAWTPSLTPTPPGISLPAQG